MDYVIQRPCSEDCRQLCYKISTFQFCDWIRWSTSCSVIGWMWSLPVLWSDDSDLFQFCDWMMWSLTMSLWNIRVLMSESLPEPVIWWCDLGPGSDALDDVITSSYEWLYMKSDALSMVLRCIWMTSDHCPDLTVIEWTCIKVKPVLWFWMMW